MKQNETSLKKLVRERYAAIAQQEKALNASSCCGATPSSNKVYHIMMDDYQETEGYVPEADLGLGCGLPTQFARIRPGDVVVDLGSGAGNDCFVARHETGPSGKVIGIDFTPEMIRKARQHAETLGFHNVEFREGDIEHMPVSDTVADVVVSNCVLNLVPNKAAVLREIFRVLKPGGHFSISDVVLKGELPEALRQDAEMYAGCIAGAVQMVDYLRFIEEAGFDVPVLQKQKPIQIPEDILQKYLNEESLKAFATGGTGIFSITVFAQKPGNSDAKPHISLAELQAAQASCSPGGSCC